MKSKKTLKQFITVTRGVGALGFVAASFSYLPTGRAELVYEPEISQSAPAAVRADDRDQMRSALQSSEKAQATVQAIQPTQVQVQQVPVQQVRQYQQPVQQVQQVQPQVQYVTPEAQPQPVAVYSVASPTQIAEAQVPAVQSGVSTSEAPQTEVQSLSKTELMRRERTRTELKNEDLLQERLEELRLRDEKRRTDQLLGAEGAAAAGQQGGTANMSIAPDALSTQGVVSPVTDHPGEVLNAPVPTAAQAQASGPNVAAYTASPYTPAAQAQIVGGQSVTAAQALPASNDDHVKLSITPRAGVSIMNADNVFTVSGKGAAGIALGMGVTDNLSVEIGYTYAEYGIGLGGMNTAYYNPYFSGTSESYVLKQNVFDAGLKLNLLGADSKFRPYIGAGAAYAKGYLNYPSAVTQMYQSISNFSPDFESSDFLGYLSVGFDAQVSRTIAIGMNARYYKVMSDSENENLYYGSFYGGGYNSDPTKLQEGTQLAQSSFYSLLGTVTFSF